MEKATRNRERTRRAVLDAAAKLFHERGMTAPLEAIAGEAGITKSGLLHHFPNRDDLTRAVVADAIEHFRANVMSHLDLAENHPGKVLRAYIRALFSSDEAQARFDYPGLWDALALVDGVTQMLTEEAESWRVSCAADGLHPERVLVAFNAAEGFVASAQWDEGITSEMARQTLDTLLAITNTNGPLAAAGS